LPPFSTPAYDRSNAERCAGCRPDQGRERLEGFIETLGRRLQKGQSFLREIPEDIVNEKPADRN
jgi:hypothetical protein